MPKVNVAGIVYDMEQLAAETDKLFEDEIASDEESSLADPDDQEPLNVTIAHVKPVKVVRDGKDAIGFRLRLQSSDTEGGSLPNVETVRSMISRIHYTIGHLPPGSSDWSAKAGKALRDKYKVGGLSDRGEDPWTLSVYDQHGRSDGHETWQAICKKSVGVDETYGLQQYGEDGAVDEEKNSLPWAARCGAEPLRSQETYTGHYNPESQEGARKSKGMLQRGFSNLENNHRWQGADTNQGRLSAYQGLVAKVDDILTQLNTPTLTVEYAQAAQEDPWISWSKGIQGLADPDEPETTDS